jgi:hypothetical protein
MARSKTSDKDIPSYPTAQALIEGEAGKIYLALEEKTFLEVAYIFGLDRFFSNESSMKSAITRAYNLVLDNPEKFGIPSERAAFIHGVVASRNINKKPETLREDKEVKAKDLSTELLSARDLATSLVKRKLEYLDKNPKALQEEKIKDLGWIMGVLFDKGQIIQGQATEHIAVLSKISDDMKPEEAMSELLNMRNQTIVNKQK